MFNLVVRVNINVNVGMHAGTCLFWSCAWELKAGLTFTTKRLSVQCAKTVIRDVNAGGRMCANTDSKGKLPGVGCERDATMALWHFGGGSRHDRYGFAGARPSLAGAPVPLAK